MDSFNPLSGMHWAALLFLIGAAAFGFLVPILSGFIAYAIADRPGLVPGIVGGSIAATMGAGFLGGLVTGFLGGSSPAGSPAGRCTRASAVSCRSSSSRCCRAHHGGLFITVLGRPIKALMMPSPPPLNGMGGSSAIVLGLILGAMMGFDLGGPVNKVAYAFATTGLAAAGTATDAPQLKIMAAVMAAGMVAPLAMALATTRPAQALHRARARERQGSLAARGLLHLRRCDPFAAADPFRVIASSVVGSAVTGALAMAFGRDLTGPTRRHLGAPAHRQLPDVPRRPRHRCPRHGRDRALPQAARPQPRRGRRGCRSRPEPAARHTNLSTTRKPAKHNPPPENNKGSHPSWHSAPSPSPRPSACTPAPPPSSSRQPTRPASTSRSAAPVRTPSTPRASSGVMALGAKHGEEVVLTAEGDGADAALDEFVALLSRDLDAE
jgi:fructose-specific phosphotransferase system IIC component